MKHSQFITEEIVSTDERTTALQLVGIYRLEILVTKGTVSFKFDKSNIVSNTLKAGNTKVFLTPTDALFSGTITFHLATNSRVELNYTRVYE